MAQRAFELGHTWSDALEVLIGEEEEPHRRARRDRGRPLSSQKGRDLAEGVARAECLGRLATVGQDSGLALFDEVDGGSVAVERGDRGTRLDLELLTAPASSSSSVAGRSAKSGNDSIRLLSTGLDRATGSNRAPRRVRLDVAARLIKTRTIVLAGSRRTPPSQRRALERARGGAPSAPGRRGSWPRPSRPTRRRTRCSSCPRPRSAAGARRREARGDVVGHDRSGGLGEYAGLCDRRACDIAKRVDVWEPGRRGWWVDGHPPVDREPGALNHFRHTVDGDPDEEVVGTLPPLASRAVLLRVSSSDTSWLGTYSILAPPEH